jgi:hypothetical protein
VFSLAPELNFLFRKYQYYWTSSSVSTRCSRLVGTVSLHFLNAISAVVLSQFSTGHPVTLSHIVWRSLFQSINADWQSTIVLVLLRRRLSCSVGGLQHTWLTVQYNVCVWNLHCWLQNMSETLTAYITCLCQ